MPYKRRKYAKKKKRYVRRRKRYSKQGVPSGMPLARTTKLRYTEIVDLGSAAGLLQRYVFSANSVFDPNVTGVGHQPMGYDNWSRLYGEYIVLGSRMSVRMIPTLTGAAGTGNALTGCYLSKEQSVPYTKGSTFIEAKRGTWRVVTWNGGVMDQKQTKMVCNYSAKKFHNVKDTKDNIQLVGLTNGNPSDRAYFIVWLEAPAASSTYSAVVTIDYIVSFREPLNLPEN